MRLRSFALVGVASLCCSAATLAPVSAQAPGSEIDSCIRIVGGDPTVIKWHPWQVALQVEGDLCGGVYIGGNWVLTAAHCFNSDDAKRVQVKAGATNVLTSGKWEPVVRVILHEKYNRTTKENDLALVKMASQQPVQAIALAKPDLVLEQCQVLEITGWGRTQFRKGGASDVLRTADVPYIDTTACNRPQSHNGKIRPGMMCAGSEKDACQGDSGGPLVLRPSKKADDLRVKGDEVLVGIISWGESCGQPKKYGVYTRVSAYRDWIEKATKGK
jgi:secreted trypsin-like serine protease